MLIIEGIWVSLVTPFRQGTLDLHSAQQLALQLSAAGIRGLVVCGDTGEVATLNESEQEKMLCAITEVVQNRCPVIMSIAGNDTRAVREKIMRLNRLRPAGFLISAPLHAAQQGICLHLEAIVEAAESPVILSDKHIDINIVTALRTSSSKIAALECGEILAQTMELSRTDLRILCGDDALLFNMLCLGGHGAISTCAHIRPDLFVRLFKLLRAGLIDHARLLYQQLLPLIKLLMLEPNPSPLKAALSMQGQIHDELRLPMTRMSALGRAKLASVLEKLNAIPATEKIKQSIAPIVIKTQRLSLVR